MKIDFTAAYREVQQLVKAQAKADSASDAPQQFGALLQSVSPEPREVEDIRAQMAPITREPEPLPVDSRGPMARYNFSAPEPVIPQIAPLQPDIIDQGEGDLSVKTPTLLGVQRVPHKTVTTELPAKERLSSNNVKELAVPAGVKHGVDPALGLAVMQIESAFDPNAISSDGHNSKGLFQLLDSTGKEQLGRLGLEAEYNPFNPEQNIELGFQYMRHLHDIFSVETDLKNQTTTNPAANSSALEKLAVAAFNAGEGRVASAQQRALSAGLDPSLYEQIEPYLPESTQEYVKKVFAARDKFEQNFQG